MKQMKIYPFFIKSLLLLLVFNACIKDNFVPLQDYSKDFLKNTQAIPSKARPFLEGIYELQEGNNRIGNELVGKWAGGKFCFFSGRNGIYLNLETGLNVSDSTFRMAGFWRSPFFAEQGEVQFKVEKTEGVRQVFNRQNNIILRGYFMQDSVGKQPLVLRFVRPFSDKVKTSSFAILAHRGGGRNSDNLPYAENSLNLIQHAEELGATGIEIDIQLTKDNIPLVYHDADINTRLTQKSPLTGDINHFNARFLRDFILLVDGQTIPTLTEALNTAIDSTNLRYVWLDVKGGERIFDIIVPIVNKALERAKAKNRYINIFYGIPTDDVYEQFVAYPNHKTLPSLCELSLDKAKTSKAQFFAPRWTLGILENETKDAKDNGVKIFTWTVDGASTMRIFLAKSEYEGILTNYPSLLAYQFYSQN
jgi:glycerophosphoryl diester phosphodiesterase